jgi:hypothetical protein
MITKTIRSIGVLLIAAGILLGIGSMYHYAFFSGNLAELVGLVFLAVCMFFSGIYVVTATDVIETVKERNHLTKGSDASSR